MKHNSMILAAACLTLAACSGGGSGGGAGRTATISLSMTDAPFVYDIVQEASISVDRITVAPGADDESGFITLYEGAPMPIDLFHLRDGITAELAECELRTGSYRQLRLRVTDARLVLTNGNVYTTEDGTIHLTSQGTSGFKVFVDPPIQIESGETTRVLLDVDLTHTFHPIPANDALTADRYNLHPVIHVSNLGETGGIQGIVSRDDGSGGTIPVASATVYVFFPGQTDPADSVSTTATNVQGEYTVLAIQPGTFDVTAVQGADSATVAGVVVEVGSVTTVDLALNP